MEQMSLFDDRPRTAPLATRLRPSSLDEFVGQEHLLGTGKMLRQLIERDRISSMIFWGPPGVGKTTLASIIAQQTKADFINFSAVTSGIKEIKDVMMQAENSLKYPGDGRTEWSNHCRGHDRHQRRSGAMHQSEVPAL